MANNYIMWHHQGWWYIIGKDDRPIAKCVDEEAAALIVEALNFTD